MRRLVLFVLVSIFATACASATPPIPDTATPTSTATIPVADITAAATLIRTLPASFTPTFTPSITPTRNTDTPTPVPSRTPIPEDALCANLIVSQIPFDNPIPLASAEDFIQVFTPERSVMVSAEVTNLDTGEVVESVSLPGGTIYDFNFSSQFYPDLAEYEYVIMLNDGERTGMCERRGTFRTFAEELLTLTPARAPEIRTEVTAEVTGELTEAADATGEVTEPAIIFAGAGGESPARQAPPFPPR